MSISWRPGKVNHLSKTGIWSFSKIMVPHMTHWLGYPPQKNLQNVSKVFFYVYSGGLKFRMWGSFPKWLLYNLECVSMGFLGVYRYTF